MKVINWGRFFLDVIKLCEPSASDIPILPTEFQNALEEYTQHFDFTGEIFDDIARWS